MHVLLDHISATLIGAAVFLLVLTVNQNKREAVADSTAFYMMIRHQEEFAQTVTRDMQGIEALLSVEETKGSFSFRGYIGDDPTIYTIVYERDYVGERNGVKHYRIKRLVDGMVVGGSADIITDWKIEARNRSGAPAGSTSAAVQVHVQFKVASHLGEAARIENSYWEGAFFPPLLQ